MRFDYIGKSPTACCVAVFDCLEGISRTLQLTMVRVYVFSSFSFQHLCIWNSCPQQSSNFQVERPWDILDLTWAAIKHNLATAMYISVKEKNAARVAMLVENRKRLSQSTAHRGAVLCSLCVVTQVGFVILPKRKPYNLLAVETTKLSRQFERGGGEYWDKTVAIIISPPSHIAYKNCVLAV